MDTTRKCKVYYVINFMLQCLKSKRKNTSKERKAVLIFKASIDTLVRTLKKYCK